MFLGILKNGQSPNIKVKHIALYKLFPKLVNLSLPFIKTKHSILFQRIIVRGCMVEWGKENAKVSHFKPHLDLSNDFIKSGGLVLSVDLQEDGFIHIKRLLLTFKRCLLEVSEKMKRDVLYTML